MTLFQRAQLKYAILQLLMNRLLMALADQEVKDGRRPHITEFLQTQIPEFSRLVADDIQHKRGVLGLAVMFPASVDNQTLKAEIDDVSGELIGLLDSILRERDDWERVS